jgi:pimeloyl-ACP methyl ester carboxylesterase
LDHATPPSDAELMADRIPGARLSVIPGAAHLANLEQPDRFTQIVRSFADEVAAKRLG